MDVGSGTRALVTGASRGIGRAIAETLAARGTTVGLAARSADELEALAEALPGEHMVLRCDVGDSESVASAVERFISEAGGLDLVVANAGIAKYGPFREMDQETVERMTQINWLGTVYTVHAALPHLLDRAHGHIAIVSSGAGHRSFPQAAVYGATKAAQRMFGEALRHELGGTGVSLTMVYPGEIATALHDHEKETMPDWYRGSASLPRSSATRAPSTTPRSCVCWARCTASPRSSPTASCARCAAPARRRGRTEAGRAVRVSAKADYAVRAAIELAASGDGVVKGEHVSQAQDIPLNFLENILGDLKHAGLVASRRGPEGGYRLARPASEITIADVIRAVEGPLASVRGERPESLSYAGTAEPLQHVWIALRANLRGVLEQVTLEHVVSGRLPPSVAELARNREAWSTR
jgi:Rrf2 family protein